MTRGALLIGAALLGLAGLACGESPADSGSSDRGPSDRSPILLITLSSLRPDVVGVLGGEAGWTPHLDALAGEADWVGTTVAASSLPVVSLVSLMTGVSPWQHQVLSRARRLPRRGVPMLAQAVAAAGYRTVARVPLDYDLEEFGLLAGYDDVAESAPIDLAATALERLAAAELWWVHLREPNLPYRRRTAELPRLADRAGGLPGQIKAWRLMPYADPRRPLPEQERAVARELFCHEVAWADHQVGELLSALRASGWWDRAWVVVTATQGTEFGEHGQILYAQNLGRRSIEVPLIVKLPLVKLPRSSGTAALPQRQRVAQRRLWATLAEAAGARPAPAHAPSLLRDADPPIVSELYQRNGVNEFSLLAGDLQLLWTTRFAPEEPEFYLAQLALAGGRPSLTESPRRILRRLEKAFRRTPPFSGPSDGEPPVIRLERWTEKGVEPVADPERTAQMARQLRRTWRRFSERERTPEEESALSELPLQEAAGLD